MRIGECVDLSCDCLRSIAPQQWAIHVPLGKLKTERMVPVDSFVCELVQRLAFFRSLDPLPADGRLLARPCSKEALVRQLRDYLHQVCHALGLSVRIVPHQLRHTYATEMLRAGVGFPVLMKLLGHTSPEMTMRYVDVALTDLQRNSNGPVLNPGILFPSQRCRPHAFELASMESSILCSLLNMCWRCSTARCHTAVLVLASIASQTGSARFSAKRASSAPPENGQRLAGYARHPPVTDPLHSHTVCSCALSTQKVTCCSTALRGS